MDADILGRSKRLTKIGACPQAGLYAYIGFSPSKGHDAGSSRFLEHLPEQRLYRV